jgi:serine/threonine protein kinase
MIDETVDHYRVTAKLGAGGIGEVVVAEDPRLDCKAAIKFLSANVAGNPDRRRMFRTEVKAASALNRIRSVSRLRETPFRR